MMVACNVGTQWQFLIDGHVPRIFSKQLIKLILIMLTLSTQHMLQPYTPRICQRLAAVVVCTSVCPSVLPTVQVN